MSVIRYTLLLIAILVCAVVAAASGLNQGVEGASPRQLLPWAQFAEDLPSPLEVTGVELTDRPLRPEEVFAYFAALAEASPRAKLIEYARSHEGRPLVYLAVSDERTIAGLADFKTAHMKRLDSGDPGVPAGTKAVAWMAYSIHGDELSSTDAAVALAYWLVAGEDRRASNLREKMVILIDPAENPDGRARYLAQIQSFAHRSANPDQDDLSHTAVWPWGRGNHYLFDLNRDWFSQIHPESARSLEIALWLPQLMVDSHEMGADATYLFPPARHPFNPHLPAHIHPWKKVVSDAQAAALDAHGYPYFTGEWNEEFFPGYGSSWAAYHGALGVLYEMSRTSGTHVLKRGGTRRTFAQAVEHQLVSSISNLETVAANSRKIIGDQIASRLKAAEIGARGKVRAWIFPPDPRRPDRLDPFGRLLSDLGLKVEKLRTPRLVKNLNNARTGKSVSLNLPAGALLVRMDQPAGAMARVLLDPHVPMETVFFQDEREYIETGKGSRLYETTAWSMPLSMGIQAYWSGSVPSGEWRDWSPDPVKTVAKLDDQYNSVIIDGDPDNAPAVLAALLQAGVTVRIAEKPFTIDDQAFNRGAMIIRREGNIDELTTLLNGIAQAQGATLTPVGTARSQAGPDLGGSHVPVLVQPKVGVLSGMPISPTAYGSIWHLLDQQLDLRFSSLDISRFGRVDLSRYNVLVFPPIWGGTGTYRHLLGPGGVDRLRDWIKNGGTAIGIAGGAMMLSDSETALTQARYRAQSLETWPSPVWSLDAESAADAGRLSATGLRVAVEGEKKGGSKSKRKSPYDIAPILGAGAKPFTSGYDQGTALGGEPVPMAEWVASVLQPGRKSAEKEDLERVDARLRSFMPQGVLLRAELDEESWLNFGLDGDITVWFGSHDSIIADGSVAVAARFPEIDRLHLGGLLWPEAAARLSGTAYATRESLGRGQIILFAESPTYRRWMKESERMFINAVLMGPGLGTRWSRPW